MNNFDITRNQIKNSVVGCLSELPGVKSITFVGSFEESISISSISDIDIILIVDHLTESLFLDIGSKILTLKPDDCGLPDHRIILNTSFGPLKLNADKSIVLHLMIYDMEAHRKHVNESPFTCFDWEQYSAAYGRSLSEIYPVQQLQLNDLFGTRRSLSSYLSDVEARKITYRQYNFSSNGVTEQVLHKEMDSQHQKEYAFHIMKFMMMNTLKIFHQQNFKIGYAEIAEMFLMLHPPFESHIKFFQELVEWKICSGKEPKKIVPRIKSFIRDFEHWLNILYEKSTEVSFYRHARTIYNDGRYLGQGRNPAIETVDVKSISLPFFDRVITSSLRRAIETGLLLPASERIADPRLDEINYGMAEGLSIEELGNAHPYIIEGWLKGEDPRFPEGENYMDVAERLNLFLSSIIINESSKSTAVVTHNVMLRILLGKAFKILNTHWHLIQIEHLEALKFRLFENKLFPELEIAQRIRLRDQITKWKKRTL